MPGTTRYSATFDRTYEEDDRVDPPPPTNTRRSRSLSWQAHSGLDNGRPYTPLGTRQPTQRSSSTDSGPSKVPEHIPTRTVAKSAVKAHNNPFQFVKVGTCPLYKKAEEQLKKTKEVKKQDVLKEEEEEWQTNLDSWKSRRRKMSEDIFRRQEEIRQFEMEEQTAQAAQKKTKTFSEMIESRATRGRALSLCLISSPLEFKDWEFENKSLKNGSCSTFTDESEGNSTVNSDDEGVSLRGRLLHLDNRNNDNRTNGDAHIKQNNSKLETHNGDYNKLDLTANNVQMKPKDGSYIDSGLESISSSHRAGDTPDSGSDFSQDSNSSIDCDSPRTGVNILEEFSSKSLQMSPGQELSIKLTLPDKAQEFGFSFQVDKNAGQIFIASVLKGSKAEASGIQLGDQIMAVDGTGISSKQMAEITSMIQKGQVKGELTLLLWRHSKATNGFTSNGKLVESPVKQSETESGDAKLESEQYQKSIESENEMYVDDFEELQRQSELLSITNKSEVTCTKSQAQSNGNISPTSSSPNKDSVKTSSAPKLKENITNGAVDEGNKNKINSEQNSENQKKNIVKVKRVRKKGVYSLDVSGTPNQIPQGVPVNCLYPLSPVTELPSPADETKTMSSTLSSNPTTPESNSKKVIMPKKTLKEDGVQLPSSAMKESITTAALNSIGSKTIAPSDELKLSSSVKVENKTDSTNVPSSPTISKAKDSKILLESSQEDKTKVPSSPKKLKIKIKKASISSEQKSAESIPVAPTSESFVKKMVTEYQCNKGLGSDSHTDDKLINTDKREKVESSQKQDIKAVAPEDNITTPEIKCSKDNISDTISTTSTGKTKNLSLKFGTKKESKNLPSPTNSKQPKTPTDDNSKPSLGLKKEKTKLKENISSAETAVVTSDLKSTSSKDSCSASVNGEILMDAVKNLSVKIDAQDKSISLNETPAIAKPPKTPVKEKSKPTFTEKNKTKPKDETTKQMSSDLPQVNKEPSSFCMSPVTNIVKEGKCMKEGISISDSELKGIKTSSKEENVELSTKMEKEDEIVPVLPEAKSIPSKTKIGVLSTSDKRKNLSLKIESKTETVNLTAATPVSNSKQQKTSQDEKINLPFAEKKEKPKLKENNISPTETAIGMSEVKLSSSEDKTTNVKGKTLSNAVQNVSAKMDMQDKLVNLNETPAVVNTKEPKTPVREISKPIFPEKNKTKSKEKEAETVSVLQEAKSITSKVKATAVANTAASNKTNNMGKIKNLSLKMECKKETMNTTTAPEVADSKQPKTPRDEKTNISIAEKRENPKLKEISISPAETAFGISDIKPTNSKEKTASFKRETSSDAIKNSSIGTDTLDQSVNLNETPAVENTKQPKTPVKEKSKPTFTEKKKTKPKEEMPSDLPQLNKESSSLYTRPVTSIVKEGKSEKEEISTSVSGLKGIKTSSKKENLQPSIKMENEAETLPIPSEVKVVPSKIGVSNTVAASDKTKNVSLRIESKKETVNVTTAPLVADSKQQKIPQDEKTNISFAQKKEKIKLKEDDIKSIKTAASTQSSDLKDNIPASDAATSSVKSRNLSLNIGTHVDSVNMSSSSSVTNAKPPKTPQEEKSKPLFAAKRERSKSKGKVTELVVSDPSQAVETSTKSHQSNSQTNSLLTKNEDDATPAVIPQTKCDSMKEKSMSPDADSSDKSRNLSLKIDIPNEPLTLATTPPVANASQPNTPQEEKPKPRLVRKRSKPKENNVSSENSIDPAATIPTSSKEKCLDSETESTGKTRNLSLKIDGSNEFIELTATSPVASCNKEANTPQDEKPKPRLVRKKSKPKSKPTELMSPTQSEVNKESSGSSVFHISTAENVASEKTSEKNEKSEFIANDLPIKILNKKVQSSEIMDSSTGTVAVVPDMKSAAAKDKILGTITTIATNKAKNLTLNMDAQNQCMNKPATCSVANAKQPKTPTKEISISFTQKKENAKLKNINSQKVNSPAKQNEEILNSNVDSLNIVFQSEPKNTLSETQTINFKNVENDSNKKAEKDLVPDILPVEKVAEEMEKLILEQLEEEERAKELASETKHSVESSEHLLIAPPKLAEPPKEKPPPPPSPSDGSQKSLPQDSPLKRVNSTKRIKKEIHKRRSNFLGIDSADESINCSEPSIPPPPALEEILKAEMELDRQSRIKIGNASTERLTLEEKEMMEKEREIIESLESEERMKHLLNGTEDFNSVIPTSPNDVAFEEERILSLKNERKRIEVEHLLTEEQQQQLIEETQLREREEFIRKQEAGKSAQSLSDPSLSAVNASNNSKPALSSLTDKKSKVSLSGTIGDGKNLSSNSSGVSEDKSSECDGEVKASEIPAVPPKPLKKKEAIRKERERLRQEQEALQREREEHRRKLVLEQEELMKQQKSHAPDASLSRLGPLPPLVPQNFPPQLTTTINATPNARESASFPSRSHHGDTNGVAGSINSGESVELMAPPVVRQGKVPAPRKAVQIEAWGQQKMPSVRKQNHDSLTESRYNQNHWLIQEAEMRRITELKERQQRVTQLPCSQTHLAEDDVCSNPPRVPVITPTHNPHLSFAVQDKMWNYGQSSNMPPKKYPPALSKDSLHTVYPRDTSSQQAPTKPSRVVPMERQEQMLSVSGRKRCSHCNEELGRGAAMIIESLQLYYHIHCFQCCVCQAQLGNGSCGTDVRVRNNKLHCHNCYSNDEAGLKFSQV